MKKSVLLITGLIISSILLQANAAITKKTTITLENNDDSIVNPYVIHFWPTAWGITAQHELPIQEIHPQVDDSGNLVFTIDMESEYGYFSLGIKKDGDMSHLLYNYLIEEGDDVKLSISRGNDTSNQFNVKNRDIYFQGFKDFGVANLRFGGKGYDKYECRFKMDSISYLIPTTGLFNEGNYFMNNGFIEEMNLKMNILDNYKAGISKGAYQLMLADIDGKFKIDIYNYLKMQLKLKPRYANNGNVTDEFLEDYTVLVNNFILQSIPEELQFQSPFYIQSLLEKARFSLIDESLPDGDALFAYLIDNYKGLQLEKLLTTLVVIEKETFEDISSNLAFIFSCFKSWSYRNAVQFFSESFTKGAQAYNFSLTDREGEIVQLEDLKGKVILMDFWFTGCSGCNHYFKETLSKVEEEIRDLEDILFLSVSVDRTFDKWNEGISSNLYTSEHALNLYTNGKGVNHELIKYYSIRKYPSILIIDKNGKLHAIYRDSLPNEKSIVKTLTNLL
jgi:cytochrome oxidase Cu insertion factor (SCO1/SenC/PrrC family)